MNLNEINNAEWEGTHKFLAEGLLVPQVNRTDSNRLQMFTSHITQCIQVVEAEPPLVFSNFENMIGENCLGYLKLKERKEVVKKIVKNDLNYLLLTKNDNNHIELIERKDSNHLTEHYGYRNKNEIIDNYKEKDIIEKDEILFKNYNYDDEMNFTYGKNLNAVFLAYRGKTNEDGLILSESAAKDLSTYFIHKYSININDNDFLLNLYGDRENYKCFPSVGEEIENNKLLARRRIDLKEIINTLRDVDQVSLKDDIFYGRGVVADVDVYFNGNINDLEKQYYNTQVYNLIQDQNRYYEEYVNTIQELMSNPKYTFSNDVIYTYNRFKTFLNPKVKYKSKGNDFSNYMIEFIVYHETPITMGSKITGEKFAPLYSNI